LKCRSQASWRRQSANQSAKAQTRRCESQFPSEHRSRSDWVRSLPTPLQRARGPRCAACALEARAGWNVCERSEFGAVLAERCLACLRDGMCRNGMKRPRSLRSGSRSGVEASSSEGVRHPWVSGVPRWCAKRTLAGLGCQRRIGAHHAPASCPSLQTTRLNPAPSDRRRLCLAWRLRSRTSLAIREVSF